MIKIGFDCDWLKPIEGCCHDFHLINFQTITCTDNPGKLRVILTLVGLTVAVEV